MSFSWSEMSARPGRVPPTAAAPRVRPPRTCVPPPRPAERAGARRLERVETRGEHGLHRVRQLGRLGCPPRRSGAPSPRRKRVTTGALGDRRHDLGSVGNKRATSSRLCSSVSGSRKICVAERRPPPQPGAGRAARRAPGRRASAARAPTGRGARWRRACRGRPSGCPRTR